MYTDTVFGFYGYILKCFSDYPSILLRWMFEHDCLDTCCLGVLYACVLYFCICTCSVQMSMFHMERRSRNTLIIIIIIISVHLPVASKRIHLQSGLHHVCDLTIGPVRLLKI